MDAYPLLAQIAALLEWHGLQVVLIGNAAAALQGALVTVVDFDFLFRPTPTNKKKLRALTADLRAVLFKAHYPTTGLHRISRDDDGLQLDFMGELDGNASFDDQCQRAIEMPFGGAHLLVAALPKVITSEHPTAHPRTSEITPSRVPRLAKSRPTRKARLDALKKEDDLAERALIRRLLALPPEKRTHFLRKRIGFRMSCL